MSSISQDALKAALAAKDNKRSQDKKPQPERKATEDLKPEKNQDVRAASKGNLPFDYRVRSWSEPITPSSANSFAFPVSNKVDDLKSKLSKILQLTAIDDAGSSYQRLHSKKTGVNHINNNPACPAMMVFLNKKGINQHYVDVKLPEGVALPVEVQAAAKGSKRIFFSAQTGQNGDAMHCEMGLFSKEEINKMVSTEGGRVSKSCSIEIFTTNPQLKMNGAKVTVLATEDDDLKIADEKAASELKKTDEKRNLEFQISRGLKGNKSIQVQAPAIEIQGMDPKRTEHFFSVITPNNGEPPIVTLHEILPEEQGLSLALLVQQLFNEPTLAKLFQIMEREKKLCREKSAAPTPSHLEAPFRTLQEVCKLIPVRSKLRKIRTAASCDMTSPDIAQNVLNTQNKAEVSVDHLDPVRDPGTVSEGSAKRTRHRAATFCYGGANRLAMLKDMQAKMPKRQPGEPDDSIPKPPAPKNTVDFDVQAFALELYRLRDKKMAQLALAQNSAPVSDPSKRTMPGIPAVNAAKPSVAFSAPVAVGNSSAANANSNPVSAGTNPALNGPGDNQPAPKKAVQWRIN